MQPNVQLGEFNIHWLQGGSLELDGGAMFGVVPKVLWSKRWQATDDNYLHMYCRPLLVQTGLENVLIETGLGNKLSEKQRQIFRVREPWNPDKDLSELGLTRESIDYVILTHCDFDHAGGLLAQKGDGSSGPSFPNAQVVVQQAEWKDVMQPNIRSGHTYWSNNFDTLDQNKLLLVDGEQEIVPGVKVAATGGHTRGHQLVEIVSEGKQAVHLGDLFPTHYHSNPLWIMAYDNFPMQVIEVKKRLLERYAAAGAWFLFYHDPVYAAIQMDEAGEVTNGLSW